MKLKNPFACVIFMLIFLQVFFDSGKKIINVGRPVGIIENVKSYTPWNEIDEEEFEGWFGRKPTKNEASRVS